VTRGPSPGALDTTLRRKIRVQGVQAVQKGNLTAILSQVGSQVQETEGFQPEVVGGKIADPGVYQQACFLFSGHEGNIASCVRVNKGKALTGCTSLSPRREKRLEAKYVYC
jgi:hypothetical protein